MDIPYAASYIAKQAAALQQLELPEPYRTIFEERIDSCHFEYSGSTHAIRVRSEHLHASDIYPDLEYTLQNTTESAASGIRSLKVTANIMQGGENLYVYKKTYYGPEDFHDSRYDPAFSPVAYPGQTVHVSAMLPEYGNEILVSAYAKEQHTQNIYYGEKRSLSKGKWEKLSCQIPAFDGGLIEEVGLCIHVKGNRGKGTTVACLMDDLYVDGNPCYGICMEKEKEELWTIVHREISQFTRLKGLFYLENNMLHLSCGDFGEVYTGKYNWDDYQVEYVVIPVVGEKLLMNVRVQGAGRCYAVALLPDNKIGILKKENDYRILATTEFMWRHGNEYKITIHAKHDTISVEVDGQELLSACDVDRPYLQGSIGLGVLEGSHLACKHISVS